MPQVSPTIAIKWSMSYESVASIVSRADPENTITLHYDLNPFLGPPEARHWSHAKSWMRDLTHSVVVVISLSL